MSNMNTINGLIDQLITEARSMGVTLQVSFFPPNEGQGEYVSVEVSRYEQLRRDRPNDTPIPF